MYKPNYVADISRNKINQNNLTNEVVLRSYYLFDKFTLAFPEIAYF